MNLSRLLACIVLLAGFAALAVTADPDPNNGTINGRVVSPEGTPLPEMPVKLFRAKNARDKIADPIPTPGRAPGMDAVAETKTGKDGTFKLENIVPGDYIVIAGDALKGLGRGPAAVRAGKTIEVKLTVRKRRVA